MVLQSHLDTVNQPDMRNREGMSLTCKLICIVFTLIHSFSLLKADVFFYEQELILHSRKDINNFYINLHAITSLTKKIEDSIAFFKKKYTKSFDKDPIMTNLYAWLKNEAKVCSKLIKLKRDKALKLARDSLPDEIHVHLDKTKRNKRAFKPLGELISFISGVPSPTSWEKFSSLVNNLREVVLGNVNATHTISSSIKDITEQTLKLTKEYEGLTKITWKLDGEHSKLMFFIQGAHKLKLICSEGNLLVENLLEEAEFMEDIRNKARENLPSDKLFPLKLIHEKIRLLEREKNNVYPLFRDKASIEQLYAMSSSITTIDNNVIHSVVSIPLVNFNQRYTFIDPSLSETEINVIEKMSKLARHQIDHIICGQDHKMRVMSTRKLQRCLKTKDSKIFFCSERSLVHLKHNSYRCSKLPGTLLMELSEHKILLKTNLKSMDITCNEILKQVPINKTYNIIELNPNCKIQTADFSLAEINDKTVMEIHAEPFKIIGYDLEEPSIIDLTKLQAKHEKLHKITVELGKGQETLRDDQTAIEIADKANQKRVESIKEDQNTNKTFTWSLGGTSLGVAGIGAIAGLIILGKSCANQKKEGMNITLKSEKRSEQQEEES